MGRMELVLNPQNMVPQVLVQEFSLVVSIWWSSSAKWSTRWGSEAGGVGGVGTAGTGYPGGVKPPKYGVPVGSGIAGGATPTGTGIGTMLGGVAGTGQPFVPAGKPAKYPTLAPEGTPSPGATGIATGVHPGVGVLQPSGVQPGGKYEFSLVLEFYSQVEYSLVLEFYSQVGIQVELNPPNMVRKSDKLCKSPVTLHDIPPGVQPGVATGVQPGVPTGVQPGVQYYPGVQYPGVQYPGVQYPGVQYPGVQYPGVLPGAKPLKAPGAGGAGVLPSTGGVRYPTGVGLGAAKPPKPGYGSLGTGYPAGGVVPGYGGYQPHYPGYGPGGAGLTAQQAKAAKYGALQGFLGGGYRGVPGCQGKYCGRKRK
ncbi:hypothetical protein SKAU_G00079340 [Synaphobranchus kaupii]|uniref:Elastin n=1 Tax=Synaphobranchus kaupii TaxID=118154 RepID=A0A9Q1J5B8_SYNKA|nr:hypothetical protein SKAU_G00079340 [Synaphobranchus kaupii]